MHTIREGDIYKTIVIEGITFEIRYGYTTEEERSRWEPVPLYPDFVKTPEYTAEGYHFATAYQDGCRYYRAKPNATDEKWCSDCRHFEKCEEYIGICKCEKKREPIFRESEEYDGTPVLPRVARPAKQNC